MTHILTQQDMWTYGGARCPSCGARFEKGQEIDFPPPDGGLPAAARHIRCDPAQVACYRQQLRQRASELGSMAQDARLGMDVRVASEPR